MTTLTLTSFTGINNVQPEQVLLPDAKKGRSALVEARNVDIGLAGQLQRRQGFTVAQAGSTWKWVFETDAYALAVHSGDLVRVVGNVVTTLRAGVGTARMWYHQLPDGRVAYANGTVTGLVSAAGITLWGVPEPASLGTITPGTSGGLYAGGYRVGLCYRRTADGVQGGLLTSTKVDVAANGSIALTGLPTLAGYSIDVYLTHHNGEVFRYAGNTATSSFTFTGGVADLVREAVTLNIYPPPPGTLITSWRGQVFIADGPYLWESLPTRPEHFDLSGAGRTFSSNITLLQAVETGIFVGTSGEQGALSFLPGQTGRSLGFKKVADGAVALGSGVTVPGKYLLRGDGTAGDGDSMLCICDRWITAGYPDGTTAALTENTYRTGAAEVVATFRLLGENDNRIPQYIATPL